MDDAVDLQSASIKQLTQLRGVSAPVARRLVDARPFASLDHVVPERVACVGRGTLGWIREHSCLTPAPVTTTDREYRWAYRQNTTTVELDGFSLTMPAGVLDKSSAWLWVAPQDLEPTAP